jgi:hypothetical protein
MDTSTPVLPKGRVGTVAGVSAAVASLFTGVMSAPIPAVPVAFKKRRRDQWFSFILIVGTSVEFILS